MTRKDYKLIAKAISEAVNTYSTERLATANPNEVLTLVTANLSHSLGEDNPRFDKARFWSACGVLSAKENA